MLVKRYMGILMKHCQGNRGLLVRAVDCEARGLIKFVDIEE